MWTWKCHWRVKQFKTDKTTLYSVLMWIHLSWLLHFFYCNLWGVMNEWMMHLYCDLLCISVHPVRFTIVGGGGGVSPHPPPVCRMMRWQPQDNGARTPTTHQLQVERRERDRANQVNEGYQEAMIDKGQWREFWTSEHRGYTHTLYDKCHRIFNDHRESGPRFNVSSERRCLLIV